MRGGANGGRLRLAPQKDWHVNQPEEVKKVIDTLEAIGKKFNDSAKRGMRISTADMIVLGGAAAIEEASRKANVTVSVPFTAGRVDVGQDSVNEGSFSHLEPKADGFRNYFKADENMRSPTAMLVDKASQLNLTVPEMTVLVGGLGDWRKCCWSNCGRVDELKRDSRQSVFYPLTGHEHFME